MAHFKGLALLGGIFVVLPLLLFFGLRWLAWRWLRMPVSSRAASEITLAGYVFYACLVLFLLRCAIAYNVDPTGQVGSFLHTRPAG